MRCVADVTIQHGEAGGPPVGKSHLHKRISVELIATCDGLPGLSLTIKSDKELILPIAPPLTLHAQCLSQGRLGLRFLRFRPNAWSRAEKTLQINIDVGQERRAIDGLAKLHARLHSLLASGTWSNGVQTNSMRGRRPLAPRHLNTSSCIVPTASLTQEHHFLCRTSSSTAKFSMPQLTDDEELRLPPLSEEQAKALKLVKQGSSIFFTGCAGTGKSLLLRHIVKELPPATTFVTGTTGMASSLLGGTTINSFAGIGRCDVSQRIDVDSLVRSAAKGESGYRWRKATTLIIDEISMMDGRLFDVLETIARRVRGVDLPFGGIQLVLSGDFHQLPPVTTGGPSRSRQFAFQANSWSRCITVCIELRTVFRQSDTEFIKLLSQVRQGKVDNSMLSMLKSRCTAPLNLEDGILPTSLLTHRADVDTINGRQLQALEGNATTYHARDSGDVAVLNAACPAPSSFSLKIGAQVMLTKNISAKHKLVNGARGVIEGFTPGSKLPIVRFAAQTEDLVTVEREKFTVSHGGRVVATRLQIPLVLAWAITVHKSQGLTLDRVEVSLERAFEPGMAYVALSRAKSFEGLRVVGNIPSSVLLADPKVIEFYATLSKLQ